jgi:hypothetical protein
MEDALAKPTLYEMWEHWLSHVSDGAVLNRGSMSDLEMLRLICGGIVESRDITTPTRFDLMWLCSTLDQS